MKRIINYRDLNVFILEKDLWDVDYHNHNFYEMILIDKGYGKHRLNDVTFSYKEGDVFLLTPQDAHEFEIEKRTKFIYVKFTEQFVSDALLWIRNSETKENIQLLLVNKPIIYESAVKDSTDIEQIFQLSKILLNESNAQKNINNELIIHIFSSIIIILVRNLIEYSDMKKWFSTESEKLEQILSYLNVYALDKDKMKIENLAKEFMISENYISIYLKKHTGLSIQNHILQYRMKAAEKLLQKSSYNINEIADKLGFNDASHFNKAFKKQHEISPSEYRKLYKTETN